jgi:hypothetical protein
MPPRPPRITPPSLPHPRPETKLQEWENLDALRSHLGNAMSLQDANRGRIDVYLDRDSLTLYARPQKEWVPLNLGGGQNVNVLTQSIVGGTGGGGRGGVTVHNYLAGLQGGAWWLSPGAHGEYYHFQQQAHRELANWWDKGVSMQDYRGMLAGYAQHIEVEKAATGADGTLVWLHNPSSASTALAAMVIENDVPNSTLALVQFGHGYTSLPEFTNYSAIYSGSLSSALMLGALGPAANVEFWLYDSGYAGDHWRHVVDVQRGGVIPAALDTYVMGTEPNRWADGSFKQLHIGGNILTMTGAAALNQNLLTSSSPTFASLTISGGALVYSPATANYLRTGTVDGSDNATIYVVGAGAMGAGRGAMIYVSGNDYTASYQGGVGIYAGAPGTTGLYDGMILFGPNYTLSWQMDRSGNFVPVGSRTIGSSAVYVADAYISRTYLNATAYLDGATAGTTLNFAPIFETYYNAGDARLIISPDGAQGRRSVLSLYANFTGTGDNVARRVADIVGGYVGAWTGEYIGFEVGGSNNSFIETTERMRLTSSGLSLSSGVAFVGEYQTQSGAWAAPSGGTNGRIVTVYNSTQAASRLYVYSNGGWHYSALT